MTKPLLIIVDGNSFMHRAYNALPPISNTNGFPTQILTGVTNMINSALKKLKPQKTIIVFDHKGKTFRHEMFDEYKANRPSLPDDFRKQIEPLKSILTHWGFPLISIEGVEADDTMSTLAIKGKDEGYSVIMMTSDKDMNQIVQDDIGILDTKESDKRESVLYAQGVRNKMGVLPEQVVEFLALMGDKADNIPGVEGIGNKTALKLLDEYGSVDALIDRMDELKGKMGEKFRNSVQNGDLQQSLELVKIKTDVDVPSVAEINGIKNDEILVELLNEYQLFNLKKALGLIDTGLASVSYDHSFDKDEINNILLNPNSNEYFIEDLSENNNYILISNNSEDKVFVVHIEEHLNELNHFINYSVENKTDIVSLSIKDVLNQLYKKTNNKNVFKLNTFDIRVYDYILNAGRSKKVAVDYLNNTYSKFQLSDIRDKYSLNTSNPKLDKISFEELYKTKIEEIKISQHIFNNKDISVIFDNLMFENKVTPVLSYMEIHGSLIDSEKLISFGHELDKRLEYISKNIYEIAGEEFNIASVKVLSDILYTKLEIPVKSKSTSEKVLSDLRDSYPIIDLVLNWRSLSKLKSTYIDGLIKRMDENNRVHTTFNQTLTATTRLSSENPNLQNIPIRSDDGKVIRDSFIARDGYSILALDYSQIEIRILAHFSKDPELMRSFLENIDVHTYTASKLFNVSMEDVSDFQRRVAKAINFGLIYGMKEKSLAKELGIEVKEAKKHYKNFFNTYSTVQEYFDNELDFAKENSYIETLFERKLNTKDVHSSNSHARSHAEKATKNAKIQGSAAEIIKKAMISVFELILSEEYDAELLIQVHDELVFEVKTEIAEEFAVKVQSLMENAVTIDVPLIVDYKIADTWLKAH